MFEVNVFVHTERVHNMIISAFEGGSNYWLHSANQIEGKRHTTPQLVWWGKEDFLESDFAFEVEYDDPEKEEGNGEGKKIIRRDDIQKGLQKMLKLYPDHFADMIKENDDAITADVFMQCVIFGDVIYG